MDTFDINNFKKIAVYAYEEDGLIPKGVEFCENTYRKLFDMIFPKIQISEIFLDGPTFNQNNFRYEWYRLLHKCQNNEFDLVLIPTLKSLSDDGIQSMQLTRELIRKAKRTQVYFALEEFSSSTEDFEVSLSWNFIINNEIIKRQKRTKKFFEYMKLTKTWNN